MAEGSVRARLAAGDRCFGTMVFELFTPGIGAILANAGYDFAIFDMEHSGVGIDTIKAQVAYARGLGLEAYVRVPDGAYSTIAPVMDAGARGIMVPMVETGAQAQAIADAVRYRPEGRRGLAFGIAHDDYGGRPPAETMADANARNVVICLVETRKGIDNAADIVAVPGVDIGWLGHFDLTNDMGITAQFEHPDFLRAAEGFGRTCAAAGKAAGILDANPAMLERFAGFGYRALGYATDVAALKLAYRNGLEMLRGLPRPAAN
ncbi:MAG: aldolase/citrate lyase family protein [Alphaproteobacteria bacterium]